MFLADTRKNAEARMFHGNVHGIMRRRGKRRSRGVMLLADTGKEAESTIFLADTRDNAETAMCLAADTRNKAEARRQSWLMRGKMGGK